MYYTIQETFEKSELHTYEVYFKKMLILIREEFVHEKIDNDEQAEIL